MGCKCKETAKKAQKYTEEETIIKPKGFGWVIATVKNILITILMFSLIILVLPFMALVFVFKAITGKEMKINVSKIISKNGKSK